ncbi:MAG: PmoA family protein [Planctomycetes bacterium]|nr:PmoA family protein [Planctomycetota bacterium]
MTHRSVLPSLALLSGILLAAADGRAAGADFAVEQKPDRLVITDAGQPVATYVFRDEKILRPYFANVHAPGGIQVTRSQPPIPGLDATDHDTMHPGVWLAFGELSGHDFWRNKARIIHERFVESPAVRGGRVTFETANTLRTESGERLCEQTSRLTLAARPSGYLLIWEATFKSGERDIVFGDQEEMGLGVRLATAITEKSGGVIRNSAGAEGAKATWGRTAAWSDGSGAIGQSRAGILLMSDPENFRPSWFHNRDYGLITANPFGQSAFTGGEKSAVLVKKGEPFRLRFGIFIHAVPLGHQVDLQAEYEHFKATSRIERIESSKTSAPERPRFTNPPE